MAGEMSGMLRNEASDRLRRLDANLFHRQPAPFFLREQRDGAREAGPDGPHPFGAALRALTRWIT